MKVLIAEDDRTVRMLVRSLLQNAGYEVVEAENGRAAIDMALDFKPDLVVLDSIMPVMDGMETIAQMNAHPDLAKIAKLVLSGRRASEDIVNALRTGADDYLTKPFDRAEFLERVRKLAS